MDDETRSEYASGVVLQLPSRGGKPVFVAAVFDPYSDEAAFVAFYDGRTDDKVTAAVWADQIAETYADSERDYRRTASARIRFDELAEDVARHRRACLTLIGDIKRHGAAFGAAICEALRERIEGHVNAIREAREKRGELASEHGSHPAWLD
jgi:hypothetical protein